MLEVIRADYTYRFDPDEDKRASVACAANRTDCGGMAYLFAAAMRANDAPARVLVGRLALPREPGTDRSQLEYDRPHIRAEVFVTGVGWVPVDPANAHSGKSKPVTTFGATSTAPESCGSALNLANALGKSRDDCTTIIRPRWALASAMCLILS